MVTKVPKTSPLEVVRKSGGCVLKDMTMTLLLPVELIKITLQDVLIVQINHLNQKLEFFPN